MSLEKKLGLTFIGILSVVFCGVLVLRLTKPMPEETVEINIGGSQVAPEAPENNRPSAPTIVPEQRVVRPPSPMTAGGEVPFSKAANNYMPPPPARYAPPDLTAGALPPPPAVPLGASAGATAAAASNFTPPPISPPSVPVPPASVAVAGPAAWGADIATSANTGGGNPLRAGATAAPNIATATTSAAVVPSPFAAPNLPSVASPPATATDASREPRMIDNSVVNSRPLAAVSPPQFVSPPAVAVPNAPAAGNVSAAVAIAPAASENVTPYVFAPGDSFWSVSQKVYGDGAYYRALFAYNSDRYPHAEDVRAGSVLDIPPVEELKRRYPEMINAGAPPGFVTGEPATPAPSSTYVVQEGDTLFEIARVRLGKAARWVEVYNLNRDRLGDNLQNLRPGLEIVLPAVEAAANLR